MGIPPGLNSPKPHRSFIIPKVASTLDVVAKKMREYYIREGVLPEQKVYLNPLRERQPEDSLEKLLEKNEIPAIIEGREEFEDVDLVFTERTAYSIINGEHPYVRPFYIKHKDEEIRVTVKEVKRHFARNYPYHMVLQRYIVGRPNLLCMPVFPV